jgi:predicted N-acetyltransferase YhbS
MRYQFASLAEAGRTAADLAPLIRTAFADYEGVVCLDAAYVEWYLRRPGLGAGNAFVCLCGDEVVANVFLTLAPVRLGGDLLTVGILDTVCTHPRHQRKGLARELMARALDHLRAEGAEAAVLFTQPDSVPYGFYDRLGFREHVRIHGFRGVVLPGQTDLPVRIAPAQLARDHVSRCLAHRDGFVELTDALWNWRRRDRPVSLPVECVLVGDGEGAATAALCRADFVRSGAPNLGLALTDLSVPETVDPAEVIAAIAGARAGPLPLIWLVAECNEREVSAAVSLGLSPLPECAMVCALSPRGVSALGQPVGAWYTPVESVLGV